MLHPGGTLQGMARQAGIHLVEALFNLVPVKKTLRSSSHGLHGGTKCEVVAAVQHIQPPLAHLCSPDSWRPSGSYFG